MSEGSYINGDSLYTLYNPNSVLQNPFKELRDHTKGPCNYPYPMKPKRVSIFSRALGCFNCAETKLDSKDPKPKTVKP